MTTGSALRGNPTHTSACLSKLVRPYYDDTVRKNSILAATLSKSVDSIGSRNKNVYVNNALIKVQLKVDPHESTAIRDAQINNIISEILPEMNDSVREQSNLAVHGGDIEQTSEELNKTNKLSIKQLGGGLSNHLFVVSVETEESKSPFLQVEKVKSALVRVHTEAESVEESSEEDNCFVNRNVENKILAWLSKEGFAPKYFGRFLNGRIEQFYENYRTLTNEEMRFPKFGRAIAIALADLHRKNVPNGLLEYEEDVEGAGEIWTRIDKWISLAQRQKNNDTSCMLENMKKEWDWLKEELGPSTVTETSEGEESEDSIQKLAINFCREVVFTHMDLQSLNILTPLEKSPDFSISSLCPTSSDDNEDNEKEDLAVIRVIDFEYAGLNPRAADIGNTFCEYCDMNNLKPKYEKEYPTEAEQNMFLKTYLKNANQDLYNYLDGHSGGPEMAWEEFLTEMRLSVGKHALLSHLGWAVWAVGQSTLSSVEFDYLRYAEIRMLGYDLFKKIYWPTQSS